MIVPDTNALVHFRRFNEIPWNRLAGMSEARLVVCLLVLDELDELSYRDRSVGDRARSVIKGLRQYRAGKEPEEPVEIRPGVSMQILIDPPSHVRSPNHDDELLRRVALLASAAGNRVHVATSDYGMQIRATGRGLNYVELPDELRLPLRDGAIKRKGERA